MDKIKALYESLQGKKFFILVVSLIITTFYQAGMHEVEGFSITHIDLNEVKTLLYEALLGAGRSALSKVNR